jgi:hypothetical protein
MGAEESRKRMQIREKHTPPCPDCILVSPQDEEGNLSYNSKEEF